MIPLRSLLEKKLETKLEHPRIADFASLFLILLVKLGFRASPYELEPEDAKGWNLDSFSSCETLGFRGSRRNCDGFSFGGILRGSERPYLLLVAVVFPRH